MAVDVALIVNGRRYQGWKSVRVTRSIESLAGSFALDVSDRWSDADPWPIGPWDACRVEIGEPGRPGQVVIDGYVTGVDQSFSDTARPLSYTGKDRAATLVKCSLLVAGAGGNKWTYTNIDVAQFAAEIARPHGIKVSVQPGLELKRDPRLVAHPGETGFEAIRRAAASAGVIAVSDGAGGILITRTGTVAAASLIEGFNIKAANRSTDTDDRFARYLISSQPPGTDEAFGESLRVQAQATDDDVPLTSHTLLIRPDKGYTTADARRRADWEARIRAANSTRVTVTVQGWLQPNGTLWPLNALTRVTSPSIAVDGQMLISQVEYSISEGGQVTKMSLVRPDAFEPEPQAVVSGQSGAGWDELRKGV